MIAKASVRRRLWEHLGLDSHDGTSFREPSEQGDIIVLSLRAPLVDRFKHITSFEGFEVAVRPASAFLVENG